MGVAYAERYGLSPADEAWRARAEAFARTNVAPLAREADRAAKFPLALVKRLGDAGLLGAPLPAALGGGGASALATALIQEEMGRVDGSVRGFLAVHTGLVAQTIADFGTDAQRRDWLPRLSSGTHVGCFCLTEPTAGSDVAAMASRAVETGDRVVLDGEKHWITNGGIAEVALVFANADPAAGRKGIECYLVPTSTKGFATERMPGQDLGHRASDHARVTMRRLELPAAARLGPPRSGFRIAMAGLDHGRLGVAAGAVGIQAACLELATSFARSRRQFGQRIGDFQQIGAKLADLHASLEASRLLVHHAARQLDAGRPATSETIAAKLFATEAALVCATQALRIHGARGYSDELPLERHYRDAIALTIYEGTSEIQRLILSRQLLGKDDGAPGAARATGAAGKESR
jgi:alkylation response protein AidB-like acyl-CoA dehydrogenase